MNGGERRKKLWEIRAAADEIRNAPIETPDFTKSILDRVDAERPFLAPSVRRKLPWIHVSIGLTIAVGVLAAALVRREAPNMLAINPAPSPIMKVVECVECAASERVDSFKQTFVGPPSPSAEPTQLIELVATFAEVVESEGRASDRNQIGGSLAALSLPGGASQVLPVSSNVHSTTPAVAAANAGSLASANRQPDTTPMVRLRPSMPYIPPPAALRGLFAGAVEPDRMRPTLLESDIFSTIPPR